MQNKQSDYKQAFLEFAISRQVLRFGDFTLKSGRKSPYFFNAGLFDSGLALAKLGQFYAQTILHSGLSVDMLFGPAYKGIPLVSATAIALAQGEQAQDIPYCFNRKEVKNHGEGGQLVGAPLRGRVLLIDDVITAGTAVREALQIIRAEDAKAVAVLIALDRQERGKGDLSTLQELEQEQGLKVLSIINLEDIIAYLEKQPESQENLQAIKDYHQQYAVK